MEDFRNFIMVDRTFAVENTLAENSMLKKDNKILIGSTLVLGVVAIGLWLYLLDQENKK
ncbi:MAG: hypothetical protein RLY43_1407 [Bacteroidota bacterium]|jgi:hypothetical protein